MDFHDSTNLDEDWGFSVGVGYDFTDRLSVELSGFDLDPELPTGIKSDTDHWKGSLFYDITEPYGRIQPFVVTGLGNTNFSGDNDTSFDFGAGVKVRLTDNLEWRSAVRAFQLWKRDANQRDVGFETGLVIYFGGGGSRREATPLQSLAPTPSERPSPPRDEDNDGVPDARDACPGTDAGYAVDRDGCPIAIEEVARVDLLINFDFDRIEVKPEFYGEIEEVVRFMNEYPDTIAELEGHTDSIGTLEYNDGLAMRRAAAVKRVMVEEFNVAAGRVVTRGFGENQPVASNETESGRAQNRRVVSVVIKTVQRYRLR